MSHLENYLSILDKKTPSVSNSIRQTVDKIIPQYIKDFSYREHLTGLLLGNVQSGKTGQMFGIISAAADEGFNLMILLTTDNIKLQEQTYERALQMLHTFNVCGETDDVRFLQQGLRKPTLVIIKKNINILKQWKNHISSSKFCEGRALFIVDDEADAASLNTKVNNKEKSAINACLEGIKKLANSSIYLQVTATPQSVLLQTKISGWKPTFIHYFPPGKGYLGGNFFYTEDGSFAIKTTDDKLEELKEDSEYIPEGLKSALLSFLVSAAHIIISGGKVCNFLIHPSVSIKDHEAVAEKIGGFLNEMLYGDMQQEIIPQIKVTWEDLQQTKPDIIKFQQIMDFISESLDQTKFNIIVMNSKSIGGGDRDSGMNIIVGGNTLGRGITFSGLQTVYYSRRAKRPQADTFWQHCRMFGYDRDASLMRIFIPPFLLKLFTDLNSSNTKLLEQVANNNIEDISLIYPSGIKPTRKSVLDQNLLCIIVGGIDMFASYPKKKFVKDLDLMLDTFNSESQYHEVKLDFICDLLSKLESEKKDDWNNVAYLNCAKALNIKNSDNKAILIIRRGRDIKRGPRTMLSPDDRAWGRTFNDKVVLTLYRINGIGDDKGWVEDPGPRWMPNIRLPDNLNFYKSEE